VSDANGIAEEGERLSVLKRSAASHRERNGQVDFPARLLFRESKAASSFNPRRVQDVRLQFDKTFDGFSEIRPESA
jgi:hypothetical protein